MYEVKAIVRPEMLEGVINELRAIPGLPGIAVSQIRAYGRRVLQSGTPGIESAVVSMARLEVVVPESLVEPMTSAIAKAARTGHHGDGKILVTAVSDVIRIRTGERGRDAV